MGADYEAEYERVKEEMIRQGEQTTKISAKVKAHGTRYWLPLDGREIEVVYYEAKESDRPLVVGMHGGGFLYGGCAFDDEMWTSMCVQWQVNILSVGYRKTPQYRYPCALYDVHDAIVYVRDKMPQLDFDRGQISVFGNSAGATLAAAVCILAKERGTISFQKQLLNYPFVDLASTQQEKQTPPEEVIESEVFNDLYIDRKDAKIPTVSPVFAKTEQLAGLPEAYIVVCEHDSLRAEGEKYEQMLAEAGVKTHHKLAKDMCHAFFECGLTPKGAKLPPHIEPLKENGSLDREIAETLSFFGQAFSV
jgi:acetyl esterase